MDTITTPPKPSDDPELNLWKAIVFVLVFLIVFFCIVLSYNKDTLQDTYFTKIKEVEVIKEVIKEVEPKKISTEVFITHLKPSIDPYVAEVIAKAVNEYSDQYQLPKKMILSIIFKESSFNLSARSKENAIGLMQVIPKYHQDKIEDMGITDQRELYHVKNNIELGCRVWKTYYDISKHDLDETFHRYLSKNASEKEKNNYKHAILETWARLEFLEYQYKYQQEVNYAKNNKISDGS